jgi:putative transposase
VSRSADRWYAAVAYELPDPKPKKHKGPTAGVDLGSKTFVTVVSKGVTVDEVKPPKPYAKAKRRLKRLQRSMMRKVKGSKNREKAKARLVRVHARAKNVRADLIHKITRNLVRTYHRIGLEDLSVKGMHQTFLSRTIGDLGFGKFRRQMEYKAEARGTEQVFADRFYPSSKTCSACGEVNQNVVLKTERWECECGATHDRDRNAAMNLEQLPRGTGKVTTPAETGEQVKRKPIRCRSKKRERPTEC